MIADIEHYRTQISQAAQKSPIHFAFGTESRLDAVLEKIAVKQKDNFRIRIFRDDVANARQIGRVGVIGRMGIGDVENDGFRGRSRLGSGSGRQSDGGNE